MSFGIKPRTGDRYIDGMLQGSFWDQDSIVFSLSDGLSGETWNAPDYMANQFVTAAYQMLRYTALDGQWLGFFNDPLKAYEAGSDINLTIDSANVLFSGDLAWARGFFPNTSPEMFAGDIFINTRSAANTLPSYASGSQGYFLLLHELGHALGLKHPHDDGGASRPTFTELDIDEWDFNLFTVMSYNDTNFDLVQYNPATPMILDVLALQHLYGVNTSINASDSQWTLTESGHYETIFDPGGNNTLRLSDASSGWTVKLPEDTIGSSTTPVGWAHIESNSGLPETFYWLAGVFNTIDGSPLNDNLIGTDGPDFINGGDGDDRMVGGGGGDVFDQDPALRGGADVMEGGPGNDLYYVDHVDDVVFELPNNGYDEIRLVGPRTWSMPDHVEALTVEQPHAVVLAGNSADNTFTLARADGRVDGGGGQNRLVIDQSTVDTRIHVSADRVTLSHRTEGHQLDLARVQTVTFVDREMQLTTLQRLATIPTDTIERLATLYTTYFGRAPDADGLRYWVEQYQAGLSIESIAQSFFEQPESLSLSERTIEALIDTAYQQLFQRTPDAAGAAYWGSELQTESVSRPQFLLALTDAALSSTGLPADALLVNEKADLALYYAWHNGLSNVEDARDIMQLYTSTGSLNSAKAEVDRLSMPDQIGSQSQLITFVGTPSAGPEMFQPFV